MYCFKEKLNLGIFPLVGVEYISQHGVTQQLSIPGYSWYGER